jgi:mannose/fructose/N-acetylgalactosamine-specific phosphotransferase system component IID
MTELVYKSLENIIPLLLTLVIITAVFYFFIKKNHEPIFPAGEFFVG